MAQLDKIEARARAGRPISYAEAVKLLEAYGYMEAHQRSSHHVFAHRSGEVITVSEPHGRGDHELRRGALRSVVRAIDAVNE